MGGCCCSPGGAESVRIPVNYYRPQQIERHGSLSSIHGASSATSAGLLVDTNLETSVPDTSRTPPVQLSCVGKTCLQTMPENVQISRNKTDHLQTEHSQPITGTDGRFGGSDLSGALDKPDTKIKPDLVIDSSELAENESPKLNDSVASVLDVDIEEDDCPICLEEYVLENPRITTRCVHHFHLSCILEWMERSDICPICDLVIELFDD